MMQCKDIDERMVDFLYQELEGPELEAWTAHVGGCARCGAEVQSLQRTRQALRSLPEAEPSPAVTTRLLHEAGKRAARAQGGGFLDWLHRLVGPVIAHPAWAAAASLLIVVGVAGFLSMRGKVSQHAAIDRPTAAVPEEAVPIRDVGGDKAGGAPAAAPPATVVPDPQPLGKGEGAAAEKPRDVRAPGSPTPEYEPKVPPPAVVSAPPAKKAREDRNVSRTGRTASTEEDGVLKKPLARPKTSNLAADDALGGVGAAPPPPPSPAESAPAPAREQAEYAAPVDAERQADGDRAYAESRKESKDLKAAEPAPAPSAPPEAAPQSPATAGALADQPAQTQPQAQQTKAKAPAIKEPPEQELFRLSQKQATAGQCDEALGTRQRIQRLNPEFYRKRVAGDPVYRSCDEHSRRRAAPSSAPARQKQEATEESIDVKK
jgi:hypothetical protein